MTDLAEKLLKNKTYDAYYFPKGKTELSIEGILSVILLVLSVSRGLIPMLFNDGGLSKPTYYSISLFGIAVSVLGMYLSIRGKTEINRFLVSLLAVNFIFHVYWVLPVIILKPSFNYIVSIVYTGIFPFVILTFMRIPKQVLIKTLTGLTILVSFFVLYDFVSYNTDLIPNGYSKAIERQMLLRPDFRGPGRTGEVLRPSGITGSPNPHDSANLLLMFFTFWSAMLCTVKTNGYISFLSQH